MLDVRRIGWGVIICCLAVTTYGQQTGPLSDRVDDSLLPSGISDLPIELNGRLVYIFKDQDGTDTLHFLGDFTLTMGQKDGHVLQSHQAVIWLVHKVHQGKPYQQIRILLWQDATIREIGGTLTSGPALFVTLNSFGNITVNADDIAMQSSSDSIVFREGNRIRKALDAGLPGQFDTSVSMHVLDTTGLQTKDKTPNPRPKIQFQSQGEFKITQAPDGRQVLTVTGGVYLSRGVPASNDYLELQAESAVVFIPNRTTNTKMNASDQKGNNTYTQNRSISRGGIFGKPKNSSDDQMMTSALGDMTVESAYLEGDVVMSQGPNTIRASRLYYDFRLERAILLDAIVRSTLDKRNIPFYLRAKEIRQLSRSSYVANNAIFTTSEFHTPHYHIGAQRVELSEITPADPANRSSGIGSGRFTISHATLNVGGTPILYWPYIRGNINTGETSIKGIRTGYSSDFGVEIETDWHLFNLLGFETPEGVDAKLSLDYFSERGPAVGIEADYSRRNYYGLIKSYILDDNDEDFLGRDRIVQPSQDLRGRFLLRHRQFLDEDWQLTLEVSYISDEGFLEEFFESEFDKDKEQETLLHLKKQYDNWAFVAMAQSRILDFTTQTERFPELSWHLVGEQLNNNITWYSENRAGYVRYRPSTQSFRELLRNGRRRGSGAVTRGDTRQEFGMPMDVGSWRFVPFITARGTIWDDTPNSGGVSRGFGTVGVRGSIYLSRVYPEVRSSMFDLDGIRHLIKSDIVAWASATNRNPDELFPFDETIEGIDEVDGVTFGVRQRIQTKRGRGDTRRTVDVLTFDTEVGIFNNAESRAITNGYVSFSRPENSIARNFLNASIIWRMNDRTALLSNVNYDLNDGEADIVNVSVAVERSPRFSCLIGYRFIEESDSNLLGFDMNYRLSEKHTLAIREAFDLEEGRSLDFTVALIRRFPRWFSAISFALDEAEDDFGVSISIWPEGFSRATLGSSRFTDLSTSTRISND